VSRPRVVMALQLTGLVLKVCLSYVLIFGGLGLPGMGAVGGAIASLVVFWALFLMAFGYMRRSPFYHRFAIHWTWPRWSAQREILQLGIPMSLSYALGAMGGERGGGHREREREHETQRGEVGDHLMAAHHGHCRRSCRP
jgi:Na+-driven multidrug efflux pump